VGGEEGVEGEGCGGGGGGGVEVRGVRWRVGGGGKLLGGIPPLSLSLTMASRSAQVVFRGSQTRKVCVSPPQLTFTLICCSIPTPPALDGGSGPITDSCLCASLGEELELRRRFCLHQSPDTTQHSPRPRVNTASHWLSPGQLITPDVKTSIF